MKYNKKRMMAWGMALMLLQSSAASAHLFDASVPGTKMSLQKCFELASQQSLAIQAGQKSIERAKANEGTAWDMDKTEVALSQDPSSGGSVDNALSFSQSIDFPTVYVARRKQLKSETQAERSRLAVISIQLKSKIATAYYALLYQKRRLGILQRQDTILDRYHAVADKRYQAGEARQLEVLTAERLSDENHLEMGSVKGEIENLQIQMMELLNTAEPVLPAEDDLYVIQMAAPSQYAYQQTAQGQYQQDRLSALEQEIKVAKQGYAPSLSLALRTQAVITGWNPYHIDRSRFKEGNFFGFELGVGIPLFYGATKSKVKVAQKDKAVALLEMQQEQKQQESAYRQCLNRLQNAERRLKYYEGTNDGKADKLESLSALEYENGEISYVEYINVLEETMDIRMKHAGVINEYNEAALALMSLNNTL